MALKRVSPGLSDQTLTTGKQKLYTDVDLSFKAKPGTLDENGVMVGDLYKKIDTAAVVQSVETILLTNYYEKPFEPFFGANLRAMLFETVENYSQATVTDQIDRALKIWEPRVQLLDVQYFTETDIIPSGAISMREYARNTVIIKIEFAIENYPESITAQVNINRLR